MNAIDKKKVIRKCKTQNKTYCITTTKVSVFISLSAVLIVFIIFGLIFMPHYKKKIIQEIEQNTSVVRTYNLLHKNIGCGLLIDKIKKIERGINLIKKRKYNRRKAKYRRLTDKEFDQYGTILYLEEQVNSKFNPIGFVANTSGESEWDKLLKSHMDAFGLNQILKATFDLINRNCLFKYGKYDINNVKHNTQASVKYWIECQNYLRYIIEREPTVGEIAMGYNNYYVRVAKKIKANKVFTLARETRKHKVKVQWYYDNYMKGNYNVFWTGQGWSSGTKLKKEWKKVLGKK